MGATSVIHAENSVGDEAVLDVDINNNRDVLAHYLSGAEVFALQADGFIRTTSGWKYRQAVVNIGDILASSDAYSFPLLRARHDITIESVNIGVDTTVAADATNYQTVYLENSGCDTDLATLTTAGGLTQHVPVAFTTLSTLAKVISAGQTLSIRFAKTASGKALSGVTVSIVYSINALIPNVGDADDNVIRIVNEVGTDAVVLSDVASNNHLVVRNKGVEVFSVNVDGKMTGQSSDQYYYHVVNVGNIVAADSGTKKSIIFNPHCNVQIVAAYIGVNTTCLADSDTAHMRVKLVDGSGNVLTSLYIHGPYSGGTEMLKGVMYNMGAVASQYAALTSAGQLQLEYTATGTPSDIPGLTVVVCFKKTS